MCGVCDDSGQERHRQPSEVWQHRLHWSVRFSCYKREWKNFEGIERCEWFWCVFVFVAVYCKGCFAEMNNMCTACMKPIDYGDMSDVSQELWVLVTSLHCDVAHRKLSACLIPVNGEFLATRATKKPLSSEGGVTHDAGRANATFEAEHLLLWISGNSTKTFYQQVSTKTQLLSFQSLAFLLILL